MGDRLQISDDPRGLMVLPFVLTSAMLVLIGMIWWVEGGKAVWGVAFSALLLISVLYSRSRLRGAWMDDRFLYLSAGGEEEVVPLRDVMEIEGAGGGRSRTVSLRYLRVSGKPFWVWLRARFDEDHYEAQRRALRRLPHPAVEELRRRVVAAGADLGR